MTYQNYIDLHFTRWDVNDSVEISKYGYGGFHLERKINDRMKVSVYWSELDKPMLMIDKDLEDNGDVHRIPISCEVVKSIFINDKKIKLC